jgi:hypothetical protein
VLHHVTIECSRVSADAWARFWPCLGFVPVEPPPALRERFTWFAAGGTQVHLAWVESPVVPEIGHLAVLVSKEEECVARLRDGGFAVEPRREHWGAPRWTAHAPDGHAVEFFATPPPP